MMQNAPLPGLANYHENVRKASPSALYLSALSLLKESRDGRLMERYAALDTTKWYVFGENSMNPANRDYLEENDLPYVIIPSSGHFMMDDRPDIFYEKLLDMIENMNKSG